MDEATLAVMEAIETSLHRQAIAAEKHAEAWTRIADAIEGAGKIGGTIDRAACSLAKIAKEIEK